MGMSLLLMVVGWRGKAGVDHLITSPNLTNAKLGEHEKLSFAILSRTSSGERALKGCAK
jgi:hypothetical protein